MAKNELEKFDENLIRDRIYPIRGFQVMLDRDLAELYGVQTKILNKAVKRNLARFPSEFMMQLSRKEYENILNLRFQKGTSSWGGVRYLPYVFTEQGVAMLAGLLTSETAVIISVQIIRAFIAMRKFIQTNGQLFQRVDNLEFKLIETDKKVEKILDAMESGDIKPKQGIFFDGQIFDAYKFVSDLFRSAKKSVVIIDNYIDDTVLVHLTALSRSINVSIFTKTVSEKLKLDVEKFSRQYFHIEIKEFKRSYDRFIIIDEKDVYHFGASLKDLGKKWFGFSRFEMGAVSMLEKLHKQ